MASRKEKIKSKREEEARQARQVQMVVIGIAVVAIIGVVGYILYSSGVFDAPPVSLSSIDIEAGSPQAICEQVTPAANATTNSFTAAEQVLQEGVDYQAIFCTDAGAIHLELFEDQAPVTVNNLAFLASNNFYNNTIFHRVIPDFMAQAGDPTGTGRGGPGYQFQDETNNGLAFDRPYLLAMANAGPNTNGSQFFITFEPTPWLDGAHTIFGEVISGQNVVDAITVRDPQVPTSPATTLLAVVIVTPDKVTQ